MGLLILGILSLIILVGCNSTGESDNEIRESEVIGRQAIEIIDGYLDSRNSAVTAFNRIDSLDEIHVLNDLDKALDIIFLQVDLIWLY